MLMFWKSEAYNSEFTVVVKESFSDQFVCNYFLRGGGCLVYRLGLRLVWDFSETCWEDGNGPWKTQRVDLNKRMSPGIFCVGDPREGFSEECVQF